MILDIDQIPLPLAVIDLPSGKVAAFNAAAQREWQYSPACPPLTVSDIFHFAADQSALAPTSILDPEMEMTSACEAEVVTASFQSRRVLLWSTVLPPMDAKRAIVVACDITEERERENSLATDARRLKALIDANFDAYYDWHIDLNYHEWSPQFDALLALPPGQSFRRELGAWIERLHPEEADAVVAKLYRSIEQGEPYIDEYRLRSDNGEYKLVSDRGVVLFDDAGRTSDLVGVMRDITHERQAEKALRDSEALYRTLFEAETNPAIRTDQQGFILDANKAAESFFKAPQEELTQQCVSDILGEPARTILESVCGSIQSDREPAPLEATTTVAGEPRTLRLSVVPCLVADKTTYFWLGTDISDLRQLTEALSRSERSLQEQARALQERAVALRVILEQGRQERDDLAESMQSNIEVLVEPMLDRLGRFLAGRPESAYVDAIRQTLRDITGSVRPESGDDSRQFLHLNVSLTLREREITRLVRLGKTSDEIAEILHLSGSTVNFHRKNIRRKLGLTGKKSRLTSFFSVDAQDQTCSTESDHSH